MHGVVSCRLQIYDVDLVPPLLATLQDLFGNYGIKDFLLSATLRNPDTFKAFLQACETEGNFVTHQIGFESPPPESQRGFFHRIDVPIRTYKITRSLNL